MSFGPADEEETRYVALLPAVLAWIESTLTAHASIRRSVKSFGFQRLPLYFSESILTTAGVVVVDRVPTPPLSALGLTEFESFETQHMAAITFRDTYFVQANHAHAESLHFHELVHVIQWKVLGPVRFLLLYANELVRHRYANVALEQMAYRHQARFDAELGGYAVEAEVVEETSALVTLSDDSR